MVIHAIIGAVVALAVAAPIGLLLAKHAMARGLEMEKRARDAERLAHVGRLAGGLAHEIKNPLSTLNINLQLMAEDWEDDDTSDGRRLCSKIGVLRREAKRLEDILNDFLRFAKETQLQPTLCDVSQLVDEVLDFISPEAQSLHIQVRRSLGDNLPPCSLDADLFKQALLNLLINAEQAMPNGGDLMVHVRRRGRRVQIDVTDTGAGIPKDDLDNVFQVYYSTKKGGTGLGLPTARRIVEDHKGELRVQSEVGKGTNFQVLLPFADSPEPAGDSPAAPPPADGAPENTTQ